MLFYRKFQIQRLKLRIQKIVKEVDSLYFNFKSYTEIMVILIIVQEPIN